MVGATRHTALVPRPLMEKRTTTHWNNLTQARPLASAHVTMFEYGTWAIARYTGGGASERLTTSTQSVSPATTLWTVGREQSQTLGPRFPTDYPRFRFRTSLSVMLAIIKASTTMETPL